MKKPLYIDAYQKLAARTANTDLTTNEATMVAALGLCGEAGEVADMIKKVFGQGHVLDDDALLKEVGDVLWYVAAMCTARGWRLEDVARANIAKLEERYPDGFESKRSTDRLGTSLPTGDFARTRDDKRDT